MTDTIVPFKHQAQVVTLPWKRPDISSWFMVGGYFCGKSFTIVLLILEIIRRYWQFEIRVGIWAPTINFLEKTVVADLIGILSSTNSKFKYNPNKNFL